MTTPNHFRRTLLTGAGAVALSGLLPAGQAPAFAQSATARHDRRKIGDLEVIVLSDGTLSIPVEMLDRAQEAPALAALPGVGADPQRQLTFAINVALVRTPNDLVLIDAGAGGTWQPSAGKLADQLAGAGIAPESITKIVVTHAHPDHIWGLIDELDDSLRFPKAEYILPKTEWDFWRSVDLRTLPDAAQSIGAGAKRVLKAIEAKSRMVAAGGEALPGLTLIDTAGHTPGHCSVVVAAGSERLLVTSDAVQNAVTSFQHPAWQPRSDMDGPQAATSRARLLDMAATDRLDVLAYHLAYPGLGRIERKDTAYRWVPAA